MQMRSFCTVFVRYGASFLFLLFHIGATGKTLLSAQTSETIDKILAEFEEETAIALKDQLEEIKKSGYCISGPVERMQQLGYENLKASLQDAVERICQKETVLNGI